MNNLLHLVGCELDELLGAALGVGHCHLVALGAQVAVDVAGHTAPVGQARVERNADDRDGRAQGDALAAGGGRVCGGLRAR